MPSYSTPDVILVRYPFSDLTSAKVRPAVVINAPHPSSDLLITPLTSKTNALLPGEFVLLAWSAAGLNVKTAVKRGIYTIHERLVINVIGTLTTPDAERLEQSLKNGLGFSEK